MPDRCVLGSVRPAFQLFDAVVCANVNAPPATYGQSAWHEGRVPRFQLPGTADQLRVSDRKPRDRFGRGTPRVITNLEALTISGIASMRESGKWHAAESSKKIYRACVPAFVHSCSR